jgi:CRISPR-associated endonuclease/helicase Cas3
LLRTAEVFAARDSITLPDQIREVLEATYAERSSDDEPAGWQDLRDKLEEGRNKQADLAESVTRVFGQQSQPDLEGKLTRIKGAPTRDVILLRACEIITRDQWRLTPLEGKAFVVSGYEWNIHAARVLHRHLVRAPLHTVPPQNRPAWLSLHVHSGAAWAVVQGDGTCVFPDADGASALGYSPLLGLHASVGQPQPRYTEDYDEFDY